jgi:hypothetical protein
LRGALNVAHRQRHVINALELHERRTELTELTGLSIKNLIR